MNKNFFDQFFCDINQSFSLIVEDNGEVAYAYLLENEIIVGDVWLYNSKYTPKSIDWSKKENLPFLNSMDFVNEFKMRSLIKGNDEIKIQWKSDSLKNEIQAWVFINNKHVAVLKPGAKPGWSTLVKKNGPLALIYSNHELE